MNKLINCCILLIITPLFGIAQGIIGHEKNIAVSSWEVPEFLHFLPLTDSADVYSLIAHRQHLEPFTEVYQSKFSLRYKTSFSHFGIKVNTEREGKYLSKNNISAIYGVQVQLNQALWAVSGCSIGIENMSFRSITVSMSGTATVPDASLGIGLYSKNTVGYLSIENVLNNALMPLNTEFKLNRYFLLYTSHQYLIDDFYSLKFYGQYYAYSERNNILWAGIRPVINNKYGAGFALSNRSKFLIDINFRIVSNQTYSVNLSAGYEGDMSKVSVAKFPAMQFGISFKKN